MIFLEEMHTYCVPIVRFINILDLIKLPYLNRSRNPKDKDNASNLN